MKGRWQQEYYMPANADTGVVAWRQWFQRFGQQEPTSQLPAPPLLPREQGPPAGLLHYLCCPGGSPGGGSAELPAPAITPRKQQEATQPTAPLLLIQNSCIDFFRHVTASLASFQEIPGTESLREAVHVVGMFTCRTPTNVSNMHSLRINALRACQVCHVCQLCQAGCGKASRRKCGTECVSEDFQMRILHTGCQLTS
eukprot:1086295-Pelagomonas_calceolata.AAC.1